MNDVQTPSPSVDQDAKTESGNVLQVGRDYHQHDVSVYGDVFSHDEPVFFSQDVSNFDTTTFAIPSSFLEAFEKESLLIIGGHIDVDTVPLAQATVATWAEHAQLAGRTPNVGEWNRNFPIRRALQEMSNASDGCIYLFSGVSTTVFASVLKDLQSSLKRSGSRALITTTERPSEWDLGEEAAAVWPTWSKEDVYPLENRVRDLSARLTGAALDEDDHERLFKERMTICQKLDTPERIDRFASLITLEAAGGISDKNIEEALNLAGSAEDTARSFYRKLDATNAQPVPRERLLTLATCLLCGLPTDEVLATSDIIVSQAWRRRAPQMLAFDYEDLNFLKAIFHMPSAGSRKDVVRPRNANSIPVILKMAAARHGRFLQTALTSLASLIEQSIIAEKQREFEIFSSPEKRHRFRAAISETLKSLLECAPAQTTGIVWRLASHGHPGVQAVAARGLADSSTVGGVDRVLAKFGELREGSTELIKIGQAYGAKNRSDREAKRNINTTLALALGHAIRNDRVDQLDERVIREIENLMRLGASAPYIVRTFLLPFVISNHFQQLAQAGHLQRWALKSHWSEAVAAGLINASHSHGKAVPMLAEHWISQALKMPATNGSGDPDDRECLLATVAQTYANIDFERANSPFDRRQVFGHLARIAEEETHPFPRAWVMQAITRHAAKEPARIKDFLHKVLGSLGETERRKIADSFVEIFEDQRAELAGGDYAMAIGDREYEVWAQGDAPRTGIENALLTWLDDPGNGSLAPFAFRVFLLIAQRHDVPVADFLKEVNQATIDAIRNGEHDTEEQSTPVIVAPSNWLLGTIIPRLATWNHRALNASVGGILTTYISQWTRNRRVVDFVLKRFRLSGMQNVRALGESLGLGEWIYQKRNAIWIVLGLIVLSLLATCS